MLIATAYHAERWPDSSWAADAQLMRQVGIDVVILGRFAWSRLEPRRDRFHFDWFRQCVDTFGKNQLKAVVALPCLSPPPWLLERHPSILPQEEQSWCASPAGRQRVCINNAPFRKYVKRLVLEMGAQFRASPHIIGWQLSGGQTARQTLKCYCDDCTQAFRTWLKRKYGTIGRLNELWGSSFNGREYSDWHEISAPLPAEQEALPSMTLDWSRFVSNATLDFIEEQKELLGRYTSKARMSAVWTPSDDPVVDVWRLQKAVEVVSLATEAGTDGCWQMEPDLPRLDKAHWIVNLPAGPRQKGGQVGSPPRPGHLRMILMQACSSGAELAAFGRWRTCRVGNTFYEEGLVDADTSVKPQFAEISRAIGEIQELSGNDEALRPSHRAAMLLDFDWTWMLNAPPLVDGLSMRRLVTQWIAQIRRRGVGVEVVPTEADLSPYRVIALPFPSVISRPLLEKLSVWVHNGGVLCLTPLAGSRTASNGRVQAPAPGPLEELAGLEVRQLAPLQEPARVQDEESSELGRATALAELIELKGASRHAAFAEGPYTGSPALCSHRSGQGKTFYVATMPDTQLAGSVVHRVLDEAGLPTVQAEAGTVEMVEATDSGGRRYLFAFNLTSQPVEVSLPEEMQAGTELLSGKPLSGGIQIDGFDLVILT